MYFLIHSPMLIFTAKFKLHTAYWLFIIGIVCFSGSLFTLCLTGWPWLGPITPIGGILFIFGWIVCGWNLQSSKVLSSY